MNTNKPFGRSLALIAAIGSIFAHYGRHSLAAQQLVSQTVSSKQFQSRGHGRNKRSGVNVKALNKMYRHRNSTHCALQSYEPYRGSAPSGWYSGVPTPRRMWHAVNDQGYSYNLTFSTRRAALAFGHNAVLQ